MLRASTILTALLLIGCAAPQSEAPDLKPISVPMGRETKSIALQRIVINTDSKESYINVGQGLFCQPFATQKMGGREEIREGELAEAFQTELKRHNYDILGDPDVLFDDRSERDAEYYVGGLITKLEAETCLGTILGAYGSTGSTGSAYLEVQWQIYDPLNRKTVLTIQSAGSTDDAEDSVDAIVLAFTQATRNLLSNNRFFTLMTQSQRPRPAFNNTKMSLTGLRYDGSAAFSAAAVQPGAVTVRAGRGHGSGFFIDPSGFLLTNDHVVGTANTVKVILFSERELLCHVLRVNTPRDVALVKCAPEEFTALSIASKEPAIGTDILVYGTPLDEDLQGTLSKGIVSAYRSERDQRYIQSDVSVHPGNSGGPMLDARGNVVGITSRRHSRTRSEDKGLNLFIPIREALEALDVEGP